MEPIPHEFERSLRRSRLRLKVLLAVSSLGEAYLGQLAKHAGAQPHRVRWALVGHPPAYRNDLSLVGLGLVREIRDQRGRYYEITNRGRRKARSITAAWARRGGGKKGVADLGQVEPHLPGDPRTGAAPPARSLRAPP